MTPTAYRPQARSVPSVMSGLAPCQARRSPLSGPPVSPVRPAGPLCQARRSLCQARRSPLSGPPVSSVRPAGPLCHSYWSPCHSRRLLAGIQCLSLLSLLRVVLHGKSRGFPIKNVGNDRRGLKTPGMDMGESCIPAWVKAGSGPLPEDFDVMTL